MGWFLYDRDQCHERVKGLTEIRHKSLKLQISLILILHLIFSLELAYVTFQKSFLLLLLFFNKLAKFEELQIEFKDQKQGVLKSFAKLTGKHLCQSLFERLGLQLC